jgi:hypothetical protein
VDVKAILSTAGTGSESSRVGTEVAVGGISVGDGCVLAGETGLAVELADVGLTVARVVLVAMGSDVGSSEVLLSVDEQATATRSTATRTTAMRELR